MGRIELYQDGDRQVFLVAVSVYQNGTQQYAAAFKLDEPPAFIAGEFVKDHKGRPMLYRMDSQAIAAAKQLYEAKKSKL